MFLMKNNLKLFIIYNLGMYNILQYIIYKYIIL